MNENTNSLQLDIHKIIFSGSGVPDYYWPVSDKIRAEIGDEFIIELAKLISQYEKYENVDSYAIIYKYVIAEFIALFWALLLQKNANKKVDVPPNFLYLPYVMQGKKLPSPLFFEKIMRGPGGVLSFRDKYSIRRAINIFKRLDFNKGKLSIEGLNVKVVTENTLKNQIIAVHRNDLIEEHASVVDDDIVFCKINKWFSALTQQEVLDEIDNKNKGLEEQIKVLSDVSFSKFKIDLNGQYRAYLFDYVEKLSAMFRCHIKKLEGQVLPERLWLGSGGNPWHKMLSLAVLKNCGYVAGHDHGAGLAHVNNRIMGLIEFWGCTEFFVFNENCKNIFEEQKKSWVSLKNECPKISFLKNERVATVHTGFKAEQLKTIMFPPPIYDGDRGRPGPYSSNITYADWQDRFISFFVKLGYRVVLKVHPETPILPPSSFKKNCNVVVDSRPFDVVLKEVDMVVLDHLYTSIFKEVIKTNMPLIFIDFYNHPWTQHARKLFEKRAEFINADIDEENRFFVDLDRVKNAIINARVKSDDDEFFNYYYGS